MSGRTLRTFIAHAPKRSPEFRVVGVKISRFLSLEAASTWLYLHPSCHDHPDYIPLLLYADIHIYTSTFEHLASSPLPSPTSPNPINHPTNVFPPHFRSQDLRRRASGRTARAVSQLCSPRQTVCHSLAKFNLLTDQFASSSYATAKDEFEIASEETDKKSVYAADDRAAAQEELAKFKRAYEEAVGGADGEEIRNRIGSRVRELDRAVEAMEEKAMED